MWPPIEQQSDLAPSAFRKDYLIPARPVVFKGGAQQYARWLTPENLRERHGECAVRAHSAASWPPKATRVREMALGELIESLGAQQPRNSLRSLDVSRLFPGLLPETGGPTSFATSLFESSSRYEDRVHNLWIAPPGYTSGFHNDFFMDNINVQVYGRKIFLLGHPGNYASIYAKRRAMSPVNPFEPDLARFPRFARTKLMVATLDPGDAIYIPRYWWHCVTSLEVSLNLNTFAACHGVDSPWTVVTGWPLHLRLLEGVVGLIPRRALRDNRLFRPKQTVETT
jgi:hypothetical protein